MENNHLLLLIRHSAVIVAPANPSQEWVLSSEGRKKSASIASQLKDYNLSGLISSEEKKAVETGQIIAGSLNLPYRTDPGLEEQKRLTSPFFARQEDFKAAIARLFANPDELVFGEETAQEALSRFERSIQLTLDKHPKSNLAIVTHGTVMTLFICHHNPELNPLSFWNELSLPCAAVLKRPDFKLQKLIRV